MTRLYLKAGGLLNRNPPVPTKHAERCEGTSLSSRHTAWVRPLKWVCSPEKCKFNTAHARNQELRLSSKEEIFVNHWQMDTHMGILSKCFHWKVLMMLMHYNNIFHKRAIVNLRPVSVNPSTTNMLAELFFPVGSQLEAGRIFSNIPGLWTPGKLSQDNQKYLQDMVHGPWGKELPRWDSLRLMFPVSRADIEGCVLDLVGNRI